MSADYYQVIYCRKPPFRVWRRQVRMVKGGAVIGGAEILMPEQVADLERQPARAVIYEGALMVRLSLNACMFCNESAIVLCPTCRRMSCAHAGCWTFGCEVCGWVGLIDGKGALVGEGFMPLSVTGFVHEGRAVSRKRTAPIPSRRRRSWWPWAKGTDAPDTSGGFEVEPFESGDLPGMSVADAMPPSPPPRALELPSPEKEDARARLRKFLDEKKDK